MGANATVGLNGDVLVSGVAVAEITEWTLSPSAQVEDTTTFDDGRDATHLTTIITWTGSFTGNWYYGDTAGQKALFDAFDGGTTVTLYLQDMDPKSYHHGTASITGVDISVTKPGVNKVTFNFQFSGDVTHSLSAA